MGDALMNMPKHVWNQSLNKYEKQPTKSFGWKHLCKCSNNILHGPLVNKEDRSLESNLNELKKNLKSW